MKHFLEVSSCMITVWMGHYLLITLAVDSIFWLDYSLSHDREWVTTVRRISCFECGRLSVSVWFQEGSRHHKGLLSRLDWWKLWRRSVLWFVHGECVAVFMYYFIHKKQYWMIDVNCVYRSTTVLPAKITMKVSPVIRTCGVLLF